MRIDSSAVNMYGSSKSIELNTREENLLFWQNGERPPAQHESLNSGNPGSNQFISDILDLSDKGKNLLELDNLMTSEIDEDFSGLQLDEKDKHKLLLVQKMIEILTGKKVKFLIPKKIKTEALKNIQITNIGDLRARQSAAQSRAGWGLEYDLSEKHMEVQKMSYQANGSVKTADGREINFSLELNMSREFASSRNISIRAGDAVMKDPLVINFSSPTAALTQKKFSFDLDSDGKNHNISFVAPGSGFLALDLDSNGKVNDGSELFGTQSGDGFKDLSQYDADNNNWIDENDPIYDKLRIWTKDEDGTDRLLALGQKGVGAIYLGSAETAFNLKDTSNTLHGQLRSTGIFLGEDGRAGTIQHIDLAI